eukprot:11497108-Alexandrium_andersonii.AAC.1
MQRPTSGAPLPGAHQLVPRADLERVLPAAVAEMDGALRNCGEGAGPRSGRRGQSASPCSGTPAA